MPWALVAALLFLGATPAYAAEEAGPLDVNVGLFIWTIIIFIVVLVALGRFAWPNILGAVERREAHIRELLEATQRERHEAAAMLEENRRILDETRARVQEAVNETRVSGERMRAEMMAETRREQDAMIERARRDIAAERQAALDAVRREAVDVSMAAAERLVRRNLDGEDNRRLVREFLGQMSVAPATTAGL
ncbi:MAG TPA: F0F1 ATP synthase subunit B [Longimicrobium sp.]